jgi:mannose-6-phosphate isomerase-like protein (cupin superfamily)
MQHRQLQLGHGFQVVLGDGHSQAAQLSRASGETEGGPDNRHRGADQWLFVVAGAGEAVVNGETVPLEAGTLLFIERGDAHQVRNTRKEPLRTLNLYVPPAHTERGEQPRLLSLCLEARRGGPRRRHRRGREGRHAREGPQRPQGGVPGGEEAPDLPSAPAGLSGAAAGLRRPAACVVAGAGDGFAWDGAVIWFREGQGRVRKVSENAWQIIENVLICGEFAT